MAQGLPDWLEGGEVLYEKTKTRALPDWLQGGEVLYESKKQVQEPQIQKPIEPEKAILEKEISFPIREEKGIPKFFVHKFGEEEVKRTGIITKNGKPVQKVIQTENETYRIPLVNLSEIPKFKKDSDIGELSKVMVIPSDIAKKEVPKIKWDERIKRLKKYSSIKQIPSDMEDIEWSEVLQRGVKRVIPELKDIAKETYKSIKNPGEVKKGIEMLLDGLEKKGQRKRLGRIKADVHMPYTQDEKLVDNIGQIYKNRYGSTKGFKKALSENPTDVSLELLSILVPAMQLGKISKISKTSKISKVAKIAEKPFLELKPKRMGLRAKETNPRALGTNPRAMGTNPKAIRKTTKKIKGQVNKTMPGITKYISDKILQNTLAIGGFGISGLEGAALGFTIDTIMKNPSVRNVFKKAMKQAKRKKGITPKISKKQIAINPMAMELQKIKKEIEREEKE
jgi:hypothetical protein